MVKASDLVVAKRIYLTFNISFALLQVPNFQLNSGYSFFNDVS